MEKKKSGKSIFFKRTLLLSGILLLLFLVWMVFIANDLRFDKRLQTIISYLQSDSTTGIMKSVSFLGNHNFLIPANLLLIGYFLTQKRKKDALSVTIVALSSLGLMSLLKRLLHRMRPDNPLVEGITNFSFPSGHAFMSVAFYGLLIYYIVRSWERGWKRATSVSMLLFLIFIIGLSRIYLRVHYTTDVLAGWIFGMLWVIICLSLLYKKTTSYT